MNWESQQLDIFYDHILGITLPMMKTFGELSEHQESRSSRFRRSIGEVKDAYAALERSRTAASLGWTTQRNTPSAYGPRPSAQMIQDETRYSIAIDQYLRAFSDIMPTNRNTSLFPTMRPPNSFTLTSAAEMYATWSGGGATRWGKPVATTSGSPRLSTYSPCGTEDNTQRRQRELLTLAHRLEFGMPSKSTSTSEQTKDLLFHSATLSPGCHIRLTELGCRAYENSVTRKKLFDLLRNVQDFQLSDSTSLKLQQRLAEEISTSGFITRLTRSFGRAFRSLWSGLTTPI